jgi:serine protease
LNQPTYGTSFSSPLAAGTAGLMKTVNPALTPAMIIARIKETARAFPTSSDTTPQPPACTQPTVTPVQNAECICSTEVCGAGMLNAHGAVLAAQRPVVIARLDGIVGTNRQLTLNGSQSAVAAGRTAASYLWSVVSTSGGATTPTISGANQAVATVMSPSTGSYTIRFTVTDNFGTSDSATLTVTAAGDTPPITTPPPSGGDGGNTGGGGGSVSILTLLLAALMLAARRFVIHGSVAGPDPRAG